jgi:hypothetical protein
MKRLFLLVIFYFFIVSNINAQIIKGEAYVSFSGRQAVGTTTITSSDAMMGRGLGCMVDGAGQAVQNFKLTVEKNGNKKSAYSDNNSMTHDQIQLLKNLPSGSKIIFSEVKVKFQDGKVKTIKDGIYLIK